MGAQTGSFIPYTIAMTTTSDENNQSYPVLSSKEMIQIWKYDLHSLSSIFGFVTVILGIICVLARTVLYALNSTEMKDATEILVTVLNQIPMKIPSSTRSSSTSTLLPPEGTAEIEPMEESCAEDEGRKELPIVEVSLVPNKDPETTTYKRRAWFHG